MSFLKDDEKSPQLKEVKVHHSDSSSRNTITIDSEFHPASALRQMSMHKSKRKVMATWKKLTQNAEGVNQTRLNISPVCNSCAKPSTGALLTPSSGERSRICDALQAVDGSWFATSMPASCTMRR